MEPALTLYQITYQANEQSSETFTPLVQFLVSALSLSDCLARFIEKYKPFRVLDMKECAPAYLIEAVE